MNKYNLLDKNYNNNNSKNIFSNKNDFSKSEKLFVYNPYKTKDKLAYNKQHFFEKDNKN
ncbi:MULTISPECIES: hypothetical protein [unclassified Romboutsia]|uniref:hypothetical protein n=1 Tax=unclassified Romboutsia TaxID=2626894 RepID=UPI001899FDAE|nr:MULTISPECIES: hypothetical protein [unclassified Romboutsia]MDB8805761.1 hypothetical protein [Romboutsia sp. 1001216sp1]MDB8808245.1 hypothetical protein [Romboutsia sp. 1001216sp1]MDB8811514.1 hypothetical protein [Romboutsia sp. 1001216sp1]MDB8817227.1 hypothetical protein [Romboutsia sp. 1001216sp1]MDB8819826.1 hypothetical protein [Romboutsia sp. 1001216sp1]